MILEENAGLILATKQAIESNEKLQRKVEVYEAVLRQLNAYGNLVVDHNKMRELMVAIMEWQYALRDGEHTQYEYETCVQLAFDRLANKVGL
jgi:hypothetical protein